MPLFCCSLNVKKTNILLEMSLENSAAAAMWHTMIEKAL